MLKVYLVFLSNDSVHFNFIMAKRLFYYIIQLMQIYFHSLLRMMRWHCSQILFGDACDKCNAQCLIIKFTKLVRSHWSISYRKFDDDYIFTTGVMEKWILQGSFRSVKSTSWNFCKKMLIFKVCLGFKWMDLYCIQEDLFLLCTAKIIL